MLFVSEAVIASPEQNSMLNLRVNYSMCTRLIYSYFVFIASKLESGLPLRIWVFAPIKIYQVTTFNRYTFYLL